MAGGRLSFTEVCDLAESCETESDLADICALADELRHMYQHNVIDLCSIVNARSGKCSENCKFCAQSSFYRTEISTYELVDFDEAVSLAIHNAENGVSRFSLVTAGRGVSVAQLDKLGELYGRLRDETPLSLCASMGLLTVETATMLASMGVSRYHCNLETSRSYFPSVCSTHSWEDKVETIQIARNAGLDICSGGIIGLGETLKQRIELAFELFELDVLSIPLNILKPIENTPFADLPPLCEHEILLTVALFKLINPTAVIRSAGGRNVLGAHQGRLFVSGASGAIVGDYLTTVGDGLQKDLQMFDDLQLVVSPLGEKE